MKGERDESGSLDSSGEERDELLGLVALDLTVLYWSSTQ